MHGIRCHMLHIYYMKSQLACVACVACVLPHSLESWHQNKSDKKSCSAYHVVSISKRLYLPSGPVSPSNVRSQQHPLLDLGSIMLQHATAQSLQMSSSHLTELVESIWLDFNRFSQGALHVFKPWNRIKQPSSHGKENWAPAGFRLQNLIEFIDSSSDAEALLCQHEEWHCVVFVQRTSHATSAHARGHPSASSCLNIKITKKKRQRTARDSARECLCSHSTCCCASCCPHPAKFRNKNEVTFCIPR